MRRRAWCCGPLAALTLTPVLPGWAALAALPSHAAPPLQADELILQFRRPALQAALLQAGQAAAGAPARAAVQHALDVLGQRHGVALHFLRTLGVGSALVAMTPATPTPAALEARVASLAGDAEVLAVEVNARMVPFRPGAR